jgi:hypothetical protein
MFSGRLVLNTQNRRTVGRSIITYGYKTLVVKNALKLLQRLNICGPHFGLHSGKAAGQNGSQNESLHFQAADR